MVSSCCVKGCKELSRKESGVTFHSFPKDKEKRKVWEAQLRRENFTATCYTKICSKHFKEECFDRMKFGGTWLKKNAVPTIFPFSKHPKEPLAKAFSLPLDEVEVKVPLASNDNPPVEPKITISSVFQVREDGNPLTESVRNEWDECQFDSYLNSLKRKFYLGDYDENDMHSPSKAKQVLALAKNRDIVNRKIIHSLRRKNIKLERKIKSLEMKLRLKNTQTEDMMEEIATIVNPSPCISD